jgi:hypothetical protein
MPQLRAEVAGRARLLTKQNPQFFLQNPWRSVSNRAKVKYNK